MYNYADDFRANPARGEFPPRHQLARQHRVKSRQPDSKNWTQRRSNRRRDVAFVGQWYPMTEDEYKQDSGSAAGRAEESHEPGSELSRTLACFLCRYVVSGFSRTVRTIGMLAIF
jgi:hypothetical protein